MGMPGNLYGLELVVTLQPSLPKPVIPAKATGITVYLFGRPSMGVNVFRHLLCYIDSIYCFFI